MPAPTPDLPDDPCGARDPDGEFAARCRLPAGHTFHMNEHGEGWEHTSEYLMHLVRALNAEIERLREGIEGLADPLCNCTVSPMGGHVPSCASQSLLSIGRDDYVNTDALWALLNPEDSP